MDSNGESFTILTKIVIRTIWVHALVPSIANGVVANIARCVVQKVLFYVTMNEIFTPRYFDERVIGMLNMSDSEA